MLESIKKEDEINDIRLVVTSMDEWYPYINNISPARKNSMEATFLENLLEDDQYFMQIISKLSDLADILVNMPQYKEALENRFATFLENLLEDDQYFMQIISKLSDLAGILVNMPQYKEALKNGFANLLLKNNDYFKCVINDESSLNNVQYELSNYSSSIKEKFIEFILNDKNYFEKVIRNSPYQQQLAKLFSEYANILTSPIVESILSNMEYSESFDKIPEIMKTIRSKFELTNDDENDSIRTSMEIILENFPYVSSMYAILKYFSNRHCGDNATSFTPQEKELAEEMLYAIVHYGNFSRNQRTPITGFLPDNLSRSDFMKHVIGFCYVGEKLDVYFKLLAIFPTSKEKAIIENALFQSRTHIQGILSACESLMKNNKLTHEIFEKILRNPANAISIAYQNGGRRSEDKNSKIYDMTKLMLFKTHADKQPDTKSPFNALPADVIPIIAQYSIDEKDLDNESCEKAILARV